MEELTDDEQFDFGEEWGPMPSTLSILRRRVAPELFSRLLTFCDDALSGRLYTEIEESAPGYSLAPTLCECRKTTAHLRLYSSRIDCSAGAWLTILVEALYILYSDAV